METNIVSEQMAAIKWDPFVAEDGTLGYGER